MSYVLSLKNPVGKIDNMTISQEKPFRKNVRRFFGKPQWEKSKVLLVYHIKLLITQWENKKKPRDIQSPMLFDPLR
jgi:hypothetical protein